MTLEQIEIINYRSIESLSITIKKVNNTLTFCLLGINESGKSSFLKGVNLFDTDDIQYPQDYFDENQPVQVSFTYSLSQSDLIVIRNKLIKTYNFPKEIDQQIEITKVKISVKFPALQNPVKEFEEIIFFKKDILKGYALVENKATKIEKGDTETKEVSLSAFFKLNLPKHFWSYAHSVIFWESSDKFLIVDEIDLTTFSAEPEKTSIPLMNCFILSGIPSSDIPSAIKKLVQPAPIRNLESLLSDSVTAHIKAVWPDHPISIKFEINNNKISLLVEDEGVKHKAKTTGQRSDGFRQFISFLLTLSAENMNEELSRTIMLIDEPETHLHPQAQINLKDELIKITNNSNNNLVFYATHSNYMIDKQNLDRNIKVSKNKNEKTKLEIIPKSESSYSEVNYTVFNIPTTDYHNELYGYLEDVSKPKLEGLVKDRKWFNEKINREEPVSLSRYIRNAIHHPENTSNKKFTDGQLKKSIDTLRKLKYE